MDSGPRKIEKATPLRSGVRRPENKSLNRSDMSDDYTRIPLSPELRDRLRAAKAREGLSYENYLRKELDLEDDDE